MQSYRSIFKGFGGLVRGSLRFNPQKYIFFAGLNTQASTKSPIFTPQKYNIHQSSHKEGKHHTQLHPDALLLQECQVFSKAKDFSKHIAIDLGNRIITLFDSKEGEKYLERFSESDDFNSYCNTVTQNLDKFDTASDLATITMLLLRFPVLNQNTVDQISSSFTNLKSFFSVPPKILSIILDEISSESPNFKGLVNALFDQVKQKGSSLEVNEYISYLEILQKELLHEGFESSFKEFNSLIEKDAKKFLEKLNTVSPDNRVALLILFMSHDVTADIQNLTKAINVSLKSDIEELSPVKVSNYAIMLYNQGNSDPEIWESIERTVLADPESFELADLAEILSAFSFQGYGSDELYMEIDRRVGFGVDELNPHHVPTFVYAFAFAKKYRQKFFLLLADIAKAKAEIFDGYELAQLLWSYTTTFTMNEALFTKLETQLLKKVKELDLHDIQLIIDSLQISKPASPLYKAILPKLHASFTDPNQYDGIKQSLGISVLRAVLSTNDMKGVFSDLENYLSYNLKRITVEGKDFLIALGNLIGENFRALKGREQFLRLYLQTAKDFQSNKSAKLSDREKSELEFIVVNLEGLSSQ